MTYKIYGHKSPSGKWYIGRTKQELEKRWKNGNGYKDSPKFYNALLKYGNGKHSYHKGKTWKLIDGKRFWLENLFGV